MKRVEQQPEQWPAYYQITLGGQLDPHWSTWFDHLTISVDADGNTVLAGLLVDQAALYGLLAWARDLGLTLLAVARSQPDNE